MQTIAKPIYLKDLGGRINLTFRDIWLLNSHVWKPYLPPGEYYFYLPEELDVTASELSDYLDNLPYNKEIYLVGSGDTIDSIAEKLGTTKDELMTFNNLESSQNLGQGHELVYWYSPPEP